MPRYFFNVHDGADYPDLNGQELADLNAAREEAVRCVSKLLNQERFWTDKTWAMDVSDETGLLLFTLTFKAEEMPSVRSIPFRPAR